MEINYDTKFTYNNEDTGITMLDFWKFQYSNIYNMQEYIAEFIVAKALGLNTAHNQDWWTLYDIFYRNKRIEVKETSYYHAWNEDGKCSRQRTFGITKANSAYENEGTENHYERQNDIYVFCLNTGETRDSSYPLELSNWEFYIVPTSVINEKCNDQKRISLGRIKNMGFTAKRYSEIKATIDEIIDSV